MKKLLVALLLAIPATSVLAQSSDTNTFQFVMAKLEAGGGHFDQALDLIDKVIQANPGDPVVLFEKSMIEIDAGRIERAEGDLRKVVQASPDFFDAQRMLGRLLIDRSNNDKARLEEALTHLKAAFRLNPDDLGTGMAVSQILMSQEKPAEAERVVAALLERAPDQRSLNYNYAEILTKLGRGGESKPYLERAVQLDPSFGPAILQLLDIYQKENEWSKAAQVLQPLIDQDPANSELQKQQAFFWLRAGEPEKARASFKSLVEADPNDLRSRFFLAEALSDLGHSKDADKIYRDLLEKAPEDPEVLASFGLSQASQKNYDEAIKAFHSLLSVKDVPDNLKIMAETQLGFIDLQKGNNASALSEVKPYLVFDDRPNPQAINVALEALKKEKKEGEAVALLQPLVDHYSSDPFVNSRYIEMLLRSGDKLKAEQAAATQTKFGVRNTMAAAEAYIAVQDYAPAVALLAEAVRNKPDEIDLQFELGSAYERAGDSANAEKLFLRILDANPNHAPTLNYLGYMWADRGVNLDRAAEFLHKAVSLEPQNGSYVDSLGWVYYQKGKLDLAEKYLTSATELLPRDATVHEHLGDVFARRGDYVRALTVYRAALAMDPQQKDEADIRSKIAATEHRSTDQTSERR